MSKFDFTPAAAAVKTAISGENKAHDAWRKASKALYEQGLRYSMLSGETTDKETVTEVRAFIVTLLPEKMRDLIRLTGRDVAELPDLDKIQRKVYQQRVGVYLSRISGYLKAHEGITTPRGEKKPKDAAKTEGPTMPKTLREMVQVATEMAAKINTVGMSARDAANAADHLAAFLAVTRTALTVIEKKSEAPM